MSCLKLHLPVGPGFRMTSTWPDWYERGILEDREHRDQPPQLGRGVLRLVAGLERLSSALALGEVRQSCWTWALGPLTTPSK